MNLATEQQATKLAAVLVEHNIEFTYGESVDIQWAIQNGKAAIRLFIEALENRNKKNVTERVKRTLTPFFTIKTGGIAAHQLAADIYSNKNEKDARDQISEYAVGMMANTEFVISKTPGTADLVKLSIADLDFTEMPGPDEFMTNKFCAKWSAENLDGYVIELCQPEDGPQLRKQWLDQLIDTGVYCAMERITGSDTNPSVWYIGRDSNGSRWLSGRWARNHLRYSLDCVFIFRLRKIA